MIIIHFWLIWNSCFALRAFAAIRVDIGLIFVTRYDAISVDAALRFFQLITDIAASLFSIRRRRFKRATASCSSADMQLFRCRPEPSSTLIFIQPLILPHSAIWPTTVLSMSLKELLHIVSDYMRTPLKLITSYDHHRITSTLQARNTRSITSLMWWLACLSFHELGFIYLAAHMIYFDILACADFDVPTRFLTWWYSTVLFSFHIITRLFLIHEYPRSIFHSTRRYRFCAAYTFPCFYTLMIFALALFISTDSREPCRGYPLTRSILSSAYTHFCHLFLIQARRYSRISNIFDRRRCDRFDDRASLSLQYASIYIWGHDDAITARPYSSCIIWDTYWCRHE